MEPRRPERRPEPTPWWHDTPDQTPPTGEAGGGSSGGSSFPTNEPRPQTINLSDSILDQPIPVIYGSLRVIGRLGFWKYTSTSSRTLDLGVILGYGDQDTVTSPACNLDTSPAGITFSSYHPGDGTSAVSSILTGTSGWVAADTTQWQGYAHFIARIACGTGQLPPTPKFSAIVQGKLTTPIGGGTATSTTNPAVIAYDILTSSEFGNMSTSDLDDDSFQVVESFCDETMADSLARYAFTGAILERDAITAANYVLRHCNGYLYAGPDGKIHCWAEMLPPLITGTWTYSAGTLTEDSTAGAATTELEVGQLVVHDGEVGIVTAITNDDSFDATFYTGTPDTASLPVRAGGTKHIETHHWVDAPKITEQNKAQAPDVVKARFPDTVEEGQHEITVTYGSNTDKVSNMNYNVPEAAHALRAAKTKLWIAHLEKFFWSGRIAPEIGAYLEPGDVIFLSDDLVSNQPVTVQHPITVNSDGSYAVTLREFDAGAFVEGTTTTDTIPNMGQAWDPSRAPVATKIQYNYSTSHFDMIQESGGQTYVGNSSRVTTLNGSYNALPNNVALEARETGGTIRQAIKMDTSNRLTIGDGAVPVYLDASTSGGILVPDDVGIYPGWSSSSNMRFWEYESSANRHSVGSAATGAPRLELQGRPVELNSGSGPIELTGYYSFKGAQSYAGNPTTGLMTTVGMWQIWKNTSTGAIYLAYRDTSSIKKVQLT